MISGSLNAEFQDRESCEYINEQLEATGLYLNPKRELAHGQNSSWRIAPEPFGIDQETYQQLTTLGNSLLKFYQATNTLYDRACRGHEPDWVQTYLEQGKTELVLELGRMRRTRRDLPFIIRPDIILTEDGFIASELDSVPGGFGLLAALTKIYSQLDYNMIGGENGIIQGFAQAIKELADVDDPLLTIIVSQESQDYLGEMQWISQALRKIGLRSYTIRPEEIIFQDQQGLFLEVDGNLEKINIIYRFFELFDLKNIPKMDLILHAVRKRQVIITPPLKSYLEEKSLFALLHHPALEYFWLEHLGEQQYHQLKQIFPETWIVDNRPLPPHALIPGLKIGNKPVTNWNQLKDASKRERELVLKVSGFSAEAWGSRGVSIGHDLSADKWGEVIDHALASFPENPYILQRFFNGKQVQTKYFDFASEEIKIMKGRVRLCPYYFITENEVKLVGMLATICPLDKKIIHGMVDAVMVPTRLL